MLSSLKAESDSPIVTDVKQAALKGDKRSFLRQLEKLAERGEYEDVEAMLKDSKKGSPKHHHLIRSYVKGGKLDFAEEHLHAILHPDGEWKPRVAIEEDTKLTWTCVAPVAFEYHRRKNYGRVAWCWQVLEERGINVKNQGAYDMFIDSYIRTSEIQSAMGVYNKTKDLGLKVKPERVAHLIAALTVHSGAKEAIHFYDSIGSDNVEFGVKLIRHLAKIGCMQDAEDWIERFSGSRLGSPVCTAIVAGWIKRSNLGRAIEAFLKYDDRTNGPKPDRGTYSALLHGLALSRDFKALEKYYEQMIQNNITADQITFRGIISAAAKQGCYEEAKKWLRIGKEAGHNTNSWTPILAQALMTARETKQAESLLDDADPEIKLPLYKGVLQVCAQAGDLDESNRILKKMIESGTNPDIMCLNMILNCAAKIGDVAAASSLLSRYPKLGLAPDTVTMNTMINVHTRAGTVDQVDSCVEEFMASGVQPSLVSYNSLIRAHMSNGSFEKALTWFGKLKASEVSPDAYTFTTLVGEYAEDGDYEKACELRAEMTGLGASLSGEAVYTRMFETLANADPKRVDDVHRELKGYVRVGHTVTRGTVAVLNLAFGDVNRLIDACRKLNVYEEDMFLKLRP